MSTFWCKVLVLIEGLSNPLRFVQSVTAIYSIQSARNRNHYQRFIVCLFCSLECPALTSATVAVWHQRHSQDVHKLSWDSTSHSGLCPAILSQSTVMDLPHKTLLWHCCRRGLASHWRACPQYRTTLDAYDERHAKGSRLSFLSHTLGAGDWQLATLGRHSPGRVLLSLK